MLGFQVFACLVAAGALTFGFLRPRGVFRAAGFLLLAALGAPFAMAFAFAPFLGEGAGMGVAFILYIVAVLLAGVAALASAGASVRYVWDLLGRS